MTTDLGEQVATAYVPKALAQHEGIVACGVDGDCLSGDGILDGDTILVDPYAPVNDGDIAVVQVRFLTGKSRMVKHVHRLGHPERGAVRLVPSNPAYQEQVYPAEIVTVLGKVTGVYRTYK